VLAGVEEEAGFDVESVAAGFDSEEDFVSPAGFVSAAGVEASSADGFFVPPLALGA
jgi:hypothetical protein